MGDDPTNKPVPGIYFNGFAVAVSNADVSIALRVDNHTVAELKCSYTTGKTLVEKLGICVQNFEGITGHPLMTSDVVEEK